MHSRAFLLVGTSAANVLSSFSAAENACEQRHVSSLAHSPTAKEELAGWRCSERARPTPSVFLPYDAIVQALAQALHARRWFRSPAALPS